MTDALLALILLVAVPAEAVWRGRENAPQPSRTRRYVRAMATAVALDVILVLRWVAADRPAAALGLGWPIPTAGLVGLAVAVVLIAGVAAVGRRAAGGKPGPPTDKLPQTRDERRLYAAMVLVLGPSWELLYRGFLLWWLVPLVGTIAAVVVAATAYAAAHGVRDRRALAASLISALLFTTGYAATTSLWWLIAIHIGLPMLALTLRRPETA